MNAQTDNAAIVQEQFDELAREVARQTGRPLHKAQAIFTRLAGELIRDTAAHGRIRPKAQRRFKQRLQREIAYARRGHWRNHPGRR